VSISWAGWVSIHVVGTARPAVSAVMLCAVLLG
jgi:hypothetical protein